MELVELYETLQIDLKLSQTREELTVPWSWPRRRSTVAASSSAQRRTPRDLRRRRRRGHSSAPPPRRRCTPFSK